MTKKQAKIFRRRVAELIRRVRGPASQATFARSVGASQAQVSQWEAGKAVPSLMAFVVMARAAGIDMRVLLTLADEGSHE